MKIRPATISDVDLLVALNRVAQDRHAEAFPDRFRRDAPDAVVAEAFARMLQAPSAFWLVAEQEQPVGFLSAEFREQAASWCLAPRRSCYLAAIVVAPAVRRQGVARALVAALQREVRVRDVAAIDLDVWSFNDEARQAFAQLGFRRIMERMTLSLERDDKGA
jgi:diamine N-acetyltransferase